MFEHQKSLKRKCLNIRRVIVYYLLCFCFSQCKQIVEEYYTIIYNFLMTELDGQTVCTEIGLCKVKQLLGRMNERPPVSTLLLHGAAASKDAIEDFIVYLKRRNF